MQRMTQIIVYLAGAVSFMVVKHIIESAEVPWSLAFGFLAAKMQLNMSLCPSVCLSIRP